MGMVNCQNNQKKMGFRLFWPFTTNGKQDLTFLRIFLWLVRPYLHIDIQAFSDSCSVEPFLGVTLRMSTLMVKKQSGDTTNQQGRMTDMANQQKNWCYDDEDNKDNDNDHDIDMCIYNTIDSIASASTSLWSSPSIGLSSSHSEAKKWKKWRVGRLFGPQIWPSFHAMFKRKIIVHKVSELQGSMKCPCQEAKFQYFLEDVNDNNQQLSELLSPQILRWTKNTQSLDHIRKAKIAADQDFGYVSKSLVP